MVAKAKKTAAPLDLDQFFGSSDQTADLDFLLGGEPAQTAERARERGLPLLDLPLTAIAPDSSRCGVCRFQKISCAWKRPAITRLQRF